METFIPLYKPSCSASWDNDIIVPLLSEEEIIAIARVFRVGSIALSACNSMESRFK